MVENCLRGEKEDVDERCEEGSPYDSPDDGNGSGNPPLERVSVESGRAPLESNPCTPPSEAFFKVMEGGVSTEGGVSSRLPMLLKPPEEGSNLPLDEYRKRSRGCVE